MTQENPQPEPEGQADSSFAFGPTVTIFFSDIRGFTDYTDAHGDAEAYRMLQHHNGLVKEQIALYHGHIVKTLGDSYMVSFDAARNALTCAVAVQRQLAQYNSSQHGPKIEIGIGINMGEPIREGDDLFGTSVNLASRICGVAGAGRILVSEAVRYVASRLDSGEYIDRGFFEIKGFQEPQHLFEVDWSGLGAIRATQVAPPRRGQATSQASEQTSSQRPSRKLLIGGGAAVVVALVVGGFWLLGRGGGFLAASPTPTASVKAEAVAKAKEVLPTVAAVMAAKVAENSAKSASVAAASPQSIASASPAAIASGARVLSSDDFDNPNQRKFRDLRSGSGRSAGSGTSVEFNYEYRYAEGMLVAAIKPVAWPPGVMRSNLGISMESSDRLQGDLALEISARASKLPEQVRYGIGFDPGGEELITYSMSPGDGSFGAWFGRSIEARQQLIGGRSDAIRLGNQENRLRMEMRGSNLRFLVNGTELGRAQHPKPSSAAGIIELYALQTGPGTPPDVEVRFDSYRVLSPVP